MLIQVRVMCVRISVSGWYGKKGNNENRSGKAKIETVTRKKHPTSWIGAMLNYRHQFREAVW